MLFLYGWVRCLGGNGQALAAMALLAFSPFHVAYSQELRSYAFGIALILATFCVLEKYMDEKEETASQKLCIALVLLWTAELYTHYWAAFAFLAQLAYAWTGKRGSGRYRLIGAAALALAALAPWVTVLRHQLQVTGDLVFWADPPQWSNLVKTFGAYMGLQFRFASSQFDWPGPPWLQWLLAASQVAALGLGLMQAPKAARWWLIVGLGTPFLVSFVTPSLYLWYRYPVLVLPAFIVLTVYGAYRFPAIWRRIFFATWILAGGSGSMACVNRWDKANPKNVVAYVHTLEQPGSVIIRPAYFADLFAYYDQGRSLTVDQHRLDTFAKREALRGKEILLISFEVPSDPIGDALRRQYRVVSARSFPGFADLGIIVYQMK